MKALSARIPGPHWMKDIRFWILFFFLIRLYGINFPPVETGHNWRQSVVNMTARNFHEEGIDLLRPRIDIAGELSGITGMEFPAYNACIAVMIDLFGEAHWYGRLLNLIVSSIGTLFFFLLIKRYFDEEWAFYAALILLSSLWFSMGRKIIPDIFACSILFYGLERALRFIHGERGRLALFSASLSCCLAVLMKLSVGAWLILIPLAYFLPGIDKKRWFLLNILIGLLLLSVLYWYAIWVPHLVLTYGYWHFFMGIPMIEGAQEIFANVPDLLKRFFQTPLGYIGSLAMLGGIYFMIKESERKAWFIFLSVFSLFFLFILKSGDNFLIHNYYSIPLVPLFAFAAARGIKELKAPWLVAVLLAGIILEGILNQSRDFVLKPEQVELSHLEEKINSIIPQDALIWINSEGSPTAMYFAHRKGWSGYAEDLKKTGYIDSLGQKGLSYILLFEKHGVMPESLDMNVVYSDKRLHIYALGKAVKE